jgi:hypothetical protein
VFEKVLAHKQICKKIISLAGVCPLKSNRERSDVDDILHRGIVT